jgi:hypothetical protein
MASRLLPLGFVLHWLAFALLTIRHGQFPGLVAHPERWQYPYTAVVTVCSLLALLLVPVYALLHPSRFPYSWRRLVLAMLYAVVLFAVAIAPLGTDLPGYYYVPAMFGLGTIAGVLVLALMSVTYTMLRWRKRAA